MKSILCSFLLLGCFNVALADVDTSVEQKVKMEVQIYKVSGSKSKTPEVSEVIISNNEVSSAISALKNAELLSNASFLAPTGQTTPLKVGHEFSYIKTVSHSLNSKGQFVTRLTPASITEGVDMNINPTIFEKGDVVLNFDIHLSKVDFQNIQGIQLPKKTVNDFSQGVHLQPNQTLMIKGLKNHDEALVIFITPSVVAENNF